MIDLTVTCGRLTNPAIRCVGIAVNTERLDEAAALEYLALTTAQYDLPAVDPIRTGVAPIVERIAAEFGKS